jgi:hypothetical protein
LFTILALPFTYTVFFTAGYSAGAAQSETLMAISRFCAFENDLPVPLYVDGATEEKSQLPWWQILLLKLAAIPLTILIFVGGVFLDLCARFLWAKLPNGLKKQSTNLRLLALSVLIVLLRLLLGALWLTLCVWLLTVMHRVGWQKCHRYFARFLTPKGLRPS